MKSSFNHESIGLMGVALIAASIFLGGCQSKKDHKKASLEALPPFASHLRELSVESLAGYAQCSDLQKDLESLGYAWANQVIDSNINRINQGSSDVSTKETPIAESTTVTEASTANTEVNESVGFQTNNQVAGVDEADLIQSNGTFVYAALNNTLLVHDLKGALLQQEDVGHPIEGLLLVDQGLIVISSADSEEQLGLYRIQDNGTLVLTTQKTFFGSYQTARKVGNTLYNVMRQPLLFDELYEKLSLESFQQDQENSSSKKTSQAAKKSFANYPQWVHDQTPQIVSQWAQARMEQLIGKDRTSQSCDHLVQLSLLQQVTSTGVDDLNLDLDLIQTLTRVSVINPETLVVLDDSGFFSSNAQPVVYTNAEHLVVADSGWREIPTTVVTTDNSAGIRTLQRDTFITVLGLSDHQIIPQSLGVVEGVTLNQFSLDIDQNHLRVASTVGNQRVIDNNRLEQSLPVELASHSMVSILPLASGVLTTSGKVDNLGKGERIYAVRFLGNKGFVVTYRQVDPFYTLDLSNPIAPKLMGELKVPGFSNYLHPIDDTHLLAVGSNGNGGLQVAVYDTTDFANPQQQFQYVVPGWSSSSAQYDHHAFRYIPSSQLLVLPLSFYSTAGTSIPTYFNGFQLFKVSQGSGIILQGSISHGSEGCGSLPPRSLVFTASDQLVTYQSPLIQSTSLSTLLHQWSIPVSSKQGACIQPR